MDSLGNILYSCTLLHIICEHLHDLYTLNYLSGWKGLKKFTTRDSLNSPLIYILFSLTATYQAYKYQRYPIVGLVYKKCTLSFLNCKQIYLNLFFYFLKLQYTIVMWVSMPGVSVLFHMFWIHSSEFSYNKLIRFWSTSI